MIDDFKKETWKDLGPGGPNCSCCNQKVRKKEDCHKSDSALRNRRARRRLKPKDKKEE